MGRRRRRTTHAPRIQRGRLNLLTSRAPGSGAVWRPQVLVLAITLLMSACSFQGTNFLPMVIRTVVEVPSSTFTDLAGVLSRFSGGYTLAAKSKLRTAAACTCRGAWRMSCLAISSEWFGASTLMPIPVARVTVIPPGSSLPNTSSAGYVPTDGSRFHSACCSAASMLLRRSVHSTSEQTPAHKYCVPLYGFNEATTCGMEVNDLGVVRRFNCSVSSSARFTASARCDSALSAVLKAFDATVCALAASASALANSRCAAWAFANASLASARASSAMPLIASASSCATLADVAASPACLLASVIKILSKVLRMPSVLETNASKMPSPMTPTIKIIQPFFTSFFASRYSVIDDNGRACFRYGTHSSPSSRTIPTKTRTVETINNVKYSFRSVVNSRLTASSMPVSREASADDDKETRAFEIGSICWITLGAIWLLIKIAPLFSGVYHRHKEKHK
jgi:hypothetical protein